ncbi:MAG: hypothetical protein JKX73_10140 [Flavobacteriales bacterium]|nr:hypothetical protein [Flavobacteriales bacterium]
MERTLYPYIILSIFCFALLSCDTEEKTQELILDSEVIEKGNVERTYEKGKILDPLSVDGRALESYALYLPESYFTGYTWPTIILLDPQGNGKKPVKLYKELADAFGFILIGSNFSRNGKPINDVLAHIKALKHDLPDGIKIDQFRIFTVGFSGGARVAVADAMTNGDVAGVVGCGAGFPQLKTDVELAFNYLAMVGKQDFNYSEFVVLDKELSNRGSTHLLLEYGGKHEWPGPAQMVEAFKWMTVYSYSQREVINMELMDSLHKEDEKRLIKLENTSDLRAIVQFYKKMLAFYKGLANTKEQEKRYNMLLESSSFKQYEKNLESILENEMSVRNKYAQAIPQNDEEWWAKEIGSIRAAIANEADAELQMSKKRILAYLSLASFLQADMALNKDALPKTKKFLYILNLVDPQNPDYYYLSARLSLKQGKNEAAVDLLKEAAKYGFDDWERVNKEREFDPIRSYLKSVDNF